MRAAQPSGATPVNRPTPPPSPGESQTIPDGVSAETQDRQFQLEPRPAPQAIEAHQAKIDQMIHDVADKGIPQVPDSKHHEQALLHAVGFVGNDIHDFNAHVSRITQAFEDAHGAPPTPGTVLDLVRSPQSYDPDRLRRMLGAPEPYGGNTPLSNYEAGLALKPPAEKDPALNVKSWPSIQESGFFPGGMQAMATVLKGVNSIRQLSKIDSVAAPSPYNSFTQNYRNIMNASATTYKPGANPSSFEGPGARFEQYSKSVSSVSASREAQVNLIRSRVMMGMGSLPAGMKVNGVWSSDWLKLLNDTATARGYRLQQIFQQAQAMGYGQGINSYTAFSRTGFANSAQGAAARQAIQDAYNAIQGQQKFEKNNPFFAVVGQSLPVSMFNHGGLNLSAGFGNLAADPGYIASGDYRALVPNLGALGYFWGNQGTLNPTKGVPIVTAATNFTSGLANSGISSVAFALKEGSVPIQQLNTWIYASDALHGGYGSSSFEQLAQQIADALQGKNTPQMRNAFRRLATPATITEAISGGPGWDKAHPELANAANLVGTMLESAAFGAPGETIGASAFDDAAAAANEARDMDALTSIVYRNSYTADKAKRILSSIVRDDLPNALKHADSVNAPRAYFRRWYRASDGNGMIGEWNPGNLPRWLEVEHEVPQEVPGEPPVNHFEAPLQPAGERVFAGRGVTPKEGLYEAPGAPVPAWSDTVREVTGRVGDDGTNYQRFETAPGEEAYRIRGRGGELSAVRREDGAWRVKSATGAAPYGDLAKLMRPGDRLYHDATPQGATTLDSGAVELTPADEHGVQEAHIGGQQHGYVQDLSNGQNRYFRIRLNEDAAGKSQGLGSLRIHGDEAEIGNFHVPAASAAGGRGAMRMIQIALAKAADEGATKILPDSEGFTADGERVWKAVARRIQKGGMPGWVVKGDELVRGDKIGEFGATGAPVYRAAGQTFERGALVQDHTLPGDISGLEYHSENGYFLRGEASNVGPATAMRNEVARNAGKDPLAQPPEEGRYLYDLIRDGQHPDAEVRAGGMNDIEAHQALAYEFVKGHLWDGHKLETVPTRSTKLWQPIKFAGHKVPLVGTPHPFAWTRGMLGEWVPRAFTRVDTTLEGSNLPGSTFMQSLFSTLRNDFSIAGNAHTQPVLSMDAQNINRLALNLGLSPQVGKKVILDGKEVGMPSANVLTRLYAVGVAHKDAKLIQFVRNTLGDAARAQGRRGASAPNEDVFSALLDRTGEAERYDSKRPETILGNLKSRQWGAISAKTPGMSNAEADVAHAKLGAELRRRGFSPMETEGRYGGTTAPKVIRVDVKDPSFERESALYDPGEDKLYLSKQGTHADMLKKMGRKDINDLEQIQITPANASHHIERSWFIPIGTPDADQLAAKLQRVEPIPVRVGAVAGARVIPYSEDGIEKSYFVPGLTPTEGVELGKQFGQESVIHNQGLFYTGEQGGKAGTMREPMGPPERLAEDHPDDFSHTQFGQKDMKWRVPFDFENSQPRPVAEADLKPREFDSKVVGKTKKQLVQEVLDENPHLAAEDREALEELRATLDGPAVAFDTEQLANFSVPEALAPIQRAWYDLRSINTTLNKIGAFDRHLVLATDPALFEKHTFTDPLRRIIGTGSPYRVLRNRLYRRGLEDYMAAHAGARGTFDTLREYVVASEQRYNNGERGEKVGSYFRTGGANKEEINAAAAYIHRRLLSGAYHAYKTGGAYEVRRWMMETEAGQKLAESEGFEGEYGSILARLISDNLTTIEASSPGSLARWEEIAATAKNGVRNAIAKDIRKHEVDIPVSGHVPPYGYKMGFLNKLDSVGQDAVKFYMTSNKLTRGGMFHDMTAMLFDRYRHIMPDDEAFMQAVAQSRRVTRYHMLDLADAFGVEQKYRWANLFFTKHRLYAKWWLDTLAARPQVAAGASQLIDMMEKLNTQYPNQTAGTFSFTMPWAIPGTSPAGGKTTFTLPIARLLWLSESDSQPGFAAEMAHAIGAHQAIMPGTGTISYTPLDSAVATLAALAAYHLGNIKTSADAEQWMNASTKTRFQEVMARVQGSYFAQHHSYMSDQEATGIALQHMAITGAWRSAIPTAVYPADPTLTTAQERVWKEYHESGDPAERSRLLAQHPFIAAMLGASYSSPKQHVLSNQYWGLYNSLLDRHERRQDDLLKAFEKTGKAADLFGNAWQAEGAQYQKEINDLEKSARQHGATDWLHTFTTDYAAQAHKELAAGLHELYGNSISRHQIEQAANQGHPNWVSQYQNALYGPLSKQSIAKLPQQDQKAAYETRVVFEQMVAAYDSAPKDKAAKVRDDYYQQVYGPFAQQQNKLYNMIADQQKGNTTAGYNDLRQWLDSTYFKTYTVDGIKMPTPQAVHFADLPRSAQQQYVQKLYTQQWGWLSSFDKNLLGITASKSVQDGWTAFNNAVLQATTQYQRTHRGSYPRISQIQLLHYAYKLDATYPGFAADYVWGMRPTYSRLMYAKLGRSPAAQKTWQAYLGHVSQIANWAAGSSLGSNPNPTLLANWDTAFKKTVWTGLMQDGITGYFGGLPLGALPSKQYPKGGYLYQLAMSQPNDQFRKEFISWVRANPNMLSELFTTGD